MYHIIETRAGDLAYERWVTPLLASPPPEIYQDSEIDFTPDHPDKVWWLAIAHDQLVAFCAAWPREDLRWECGHNYELGHRDREQRYWPLVFAARQIWIGQRGIRCVSYLYDQPTPLHLAFGWQLTGLEDTSHEPGLEPHHWQELVYNPS